ncbi:MAG: hypothetical protein ACK4GL_03170 [Flavobacteriales bacterium]
MKRRSFLKKTAIAGAGAFAVPYILPSGRLFAASGNRIANHVVFCLFAGGVRNIESIEKSKGNLMPRLLSGNEPVSSEIAGGMSPLPPHTGSSLQSLGTLYKGFRYAQGPTGHFNGHSTAITGHYTLVDLNIKQPPQFPTIFEYYRKHNSSSNSPLNSWWIANMLGPYPSLNFSAYPGYGAKYGANFMQPHSIVNQYGHNAMSNPFQLNMQQFDKVSEMRNFFNSNFRKPNETNGDSIENLSLDYDRIQTFIKNLLTQNAAGQFANPYGVGTSMNADMYNIFFAEKVIEEFKPELLVVNMQGVDICHFNYTEYCDNLRKADFAVGRLWNRIQSTPGMANDTILIIAPEHGRNYEPNNLVDAFGQRAIDHTSDPTSREIFSLIVGPPGKVIQNQVIQQVTGESIDIVPTIVEILGFRSDIPSGLLSGRHLHEAFV